MDEMFATKSEVTVEEFEKNWPAIVKALHDLHLAVIRGVANQARAKALDEAFGVTASSPFANAESVAARIHTLERKSHY